MASLRKRRDWLVEQVAGPEEREKVAERSEEYAAQCKENEAQYDSQPVLCRLIIEKERLKDEIKRTERKSRKGKPGFVDCGHIRGDKSR